MIAIGNIPEEPQKSWFVENIVDPIGKTLDNHSFIHKVVVVVAHLFRMLAMLALISFLPFSLTVNCIISLSGSIFYRITIERNCSFRFAIPSCLGAMSLAFSLPYLITLTAQASLMLFVQALTTAVPFALYLGYVVFVSHTEVEEREAQLKTLTKPSCCS